MAAEQLSLLGLHDEPDVDPGFRDVRRLRLDDASWVDYCPGWLSGHASVYRALREGLRWRAGRRAMYDTVVDVPRLTASIPEDGRGHPILARAALCLDRRYKFNFDRWGASLYRTGHDSVAFHRDKFVRDRDRAVVGIVSVGSPRKFLLRPYGGGKSIALRCGWGDLLVMGCASQRDWEHGVPKQRAADPRISIQFRCSQFLSLEGGGKPHQKE
jgi:alkylated DNA repair dioxygenase AlkB